MKGCEQMKKLICAECVEKCASHGQKVIYIDECTLITPSAKDLAAAEGIEFCVGEAPAPACNEAPAAPAQAAAPAPACNGASNSVDANVIYNALKALMDKGMLDKIMDVCGQNVPYVSESSCDNAVKLVRGNTAQWLPLFEEGPLVDKVFYNELVNADDGSQMNAGFITIDNCEFPWLTECQEMYYVVEGTLVIKKGNQTFTANAGDVMFFEKGADLTFGSPNKMKAFYATH